MNFDATIRNDEDSLMLLMESDKAHTVVDNLKDGVRKNFYRDGKFFKLKVGRDYRDNLRNFLKLHNLTFQSL